MFDEGKAKQISSGADDGINVVSNRSVIEFHRSTIQTTNIWLHDDTPSNHSVRKIVTDRRMLCCEAVLGLKSVDGVIEVFIDFAFY